jgi:hypothetical protein
MKSEKFTQLSLEEFAAQEDCSLQTETSISTELIESSITRTYYTFRRQISPGGSTYISVNTGISNDFSKEQIEIIRDAVEIYVQRNLNPATRCAGKYGTTYPRNSAFPFPGGLPDPQNPAVTEVGVMYVAVFKSTGAYLDSGTFFPAQYRTLLINRFDEDAVTDPSTGRTTYTLGKAGVNIYNINNEILEVSLNGKLIGASSSYPGSTNRDIWAGTIAHEILHNLGWEHGANNADSYIGEYGRCVERNSADKPLALAPLPYDEICGTVSQ